MSTSIADNADQKQSLQVNLRETAADPSLQHVCEWLHACPRVVLPPLNQAAKEAVLRHYISCNVWDAHMGSVILMTATAVPFHYNCSRCASQTLHHVR